MATSGSTNYSVDRDEIITAALKLCGILGEGTTANSNQLADNAVYLNMLIKSWSKDLLLHAQDEIVVFPVKNQSVYGLGGASADRACLISELIQTELSSDHSASATTITCDDTTGMAASDVIGVQTDDDGISWSTISSVDSSTQLTIASGISSTAATDKNVYTYTNVYTYRPLDISFAQRKLDDLSYVPVNIYSHKEYKYLPDRTTNGPILNVYYDPQLSEGQLYVWQVPDDSYTDQLLYLTVHRVVEDFDSASDSVDLPQEWYLALTYNLAKYGPGVSLGTSDSKYKRLAGLAKELYDDLLAWDAEHGSIYLQPANEHHRL